MILKETVHIGSPLLMQFLDLEKLLLGEMVPKNHVTSGLYCEISRYQNFWGSFENSWYHKPRYWNSR